MLITNESLKKALDEMEEVLDGTLELAEGGRKDS